LAITSHKHGSLLRHVAGDWKLSGCASFILLQALRLFGLLLGRQYALCKLIAKSGRASPHCCRRFTFRLTDWAGVRSLDGKGGKRMVTRFKCRRSSDSSFELCRNIDAVSRPHLAHASHSAFSRMAQFSLHLLIPFAFMNIDKCHIVRGSSGKRIALYRFRIRPIRQRQSRLDQRRVPASAQSNCASVREGGHVFTRQLITHSPPHLSDVR
jgi:hypothetical protein